MTNVQIIAANEMLLISAGKMQPDEELHTFAGWKARGFSVKKGEHAIDKFTIWKYSTKGKKNADNDEEQPQGRMFMKESYFFKTSQVEPITA